MTKDTAFEPYLKHRLKNSVIKKDYDEEGLKLEIAYEINKLRQTYKLTQSDLARKLNTTQSVIARIEQGNQNFTLDTLQKIAEVFDKELRVEFA